MNKTFGGPVVKFEGTNWDDDIASLIGHTTIQGDSTVSESIVDIVSFTFFGGKNEIITFYFQSFSDPHRNSGTVEYYPSNSLEINISEGSPGVITPKRALYSALNSREQKKRKQFPRSNQGMTFY